MPTSQSAWSAMPRLFAYFEPIRISTWRQPVHGVFRSCKDCFQGRSYTRQCGRHLFWCRCQHSTQALLLAKNSINSYRKKVHRIRHTAILPWAFPRRISMTQVLLWLPMPHRKLRQMSMRSASLTRWKQKKRLLTAPCSQPMPQLQKRCLIPGANRSSSQMYRIIQGPAPPQTPPAC